MPYTAETATSELEKFMKSWEEAYNANPNKKSIFHKFFGKSIKVNSFSNCYLDAEAYYNKCDKKRNEIKQKEKEQISNLKERLTEIFNKNHDKYGYKNWGSTIFQKTYAELIVLLVCEELNNNDIIINEENFNDYVKGKHKKGIVEYNHDCLLEEYNEEYDAEHKKLVDSQGGGTFENLIISEKIKRFKSLKKPEDFKKEIDKCTNDFKGYVNNFLKVIKKNEEKKKGEYNKLIDKLKSKISTMVSSNGSNIKYARLKFYESDFKKISETIDNINKRDINYVDSQTSTKVIDESTNTQGVTLTFKIKEEKLLELKKNIFSILERKISDIISNSEAIVNNLGEMKTCVLSIIENKDKYDFNDKVTSLVKYSERVKNLLKNNVAIFNKGEYHEARAKVIERAEVLLGDKVLWERLKYDV